MDACYDREKFPTLEEAVDWLWASSKEEVEAVEFVLNRFFEKDESGHFIQPRIQEEIDKYHANSAINKRIAIAREANRRNKGTKREPVVNEPPPNQEPRTINQEPLTINHIMSPPDALALAVFFTNGFDKKPPPKKAHAIAKQFEEYYYSKRWELLEEDFSGWEELAVYWANHVYKD